MRRFPTRLGARSDTTAAGSRQQGARMAGSKSACRRRAQQRPWRLGHQPRRAVFRHRDTGCAGQVFLCLAGCADRLPGLAKELLRQDRARLRCLHGRPGNRAISFHRQGHHVFSYAVLAGDVEVFRSEGAKQYFCARLYHRQRCEDVEVTRYRDFAAALSGRGHESGVAALLHCSQAERESRGH